MTQDDEGKDRCSSTEASPAQPSCGDMERARTFATEAIKEYGEFDDEGWRRFYAEGIWNDHPAVQAALAALAAVRAETIRPYEQLVSAARALLTPRKIEKPTIAELEAILQEPDRKVRIAPDGQVYTMASLDALEEALAALSPQPKPKDEI